ncbi:hypothetical protein QCA50_007702 [Cerrena zonata]|uniref:DUF6534 domain-containing protein n=1 Tax=Cerrena zonata TaxID=2478898 RepID=A0AAW0GHU0_9APHY
MDGLPSVSAFLTPFIQTIAFGAVLYGASVVQAYYYMMNWDRDPVWMRYFVGIIIILETVGSACQFSSLNTYTVGVLNNPASILELDWTICAAPILINMVQVLVASFYIGRMWLYTKNIILASFTACLVLGRTISFAYAQHGICASRTWHEVRYSHNIRVPSILAMIFAPVSDGLIALTMVVYLFHSYTKVRRTRQVITWLVILTINTGVILVAAGICTLILYMKMPESLAYAGTLALSGKLYANSLLAMLNGRHALRSKLDDPVSLNSTSLYTSSLGFSRNVQTIPQPVRVHISREMYDNVIDIRTDMNQIKE